MPHRLAVSGRGGQRGAIVTAASATDNGVASSSDHPQQRANAPHRDREAATLQCRSAASQCHVERGALGRVAGHRGQEAAVQAVRQPEGRAKGRRGARREPPRQLGRQRR